MVPRVRVHELWRVQEPYLAQAQDDATLLAIRDMERAGIDIITDGEMRRESYSNRFATALDGIDNDNPATITNRAGRSVSVPRVVGKVRRKGRSRSGHEIPAPQHRRARPRSRCPARSPWRSRPRTSSTRTPTRW